MPFAQKSPFPKDVTGFTGAGFAPLSGAGLLSFDVVRSERRNEARRAGAIDNGLRTQNPGPITVVGVPLITSDAPQFGDTFNRLAGASPTVTAPADTLVSNDGDEVLQESPGNDMLDGAAFIASPATTKPSVRE